MLCVRSDFSGNLQELWLDFSGVYYMSARDKQDKGIDRAMMGTHYRSKFAVGKNSGGLRTFVACSNA
jgi:hypothetical protein